MESWEDYGRSLLSDDAFAEEEANRLRKELRLLESEANSKFALNALPGVSIVVATHSGSARIGALLEACVKQTLSADRFEVLIIENGSPDGTQAIIDVFSQKYPSFSFRYFWRPEASAGAARNLGIQLARMSRITFVDDDDQLEPDFLKDALAVSTGTNLVVSPIVDVQADGTRDYQNSLNTRIDSIRGSQATLPDLPWLLGFNACKLVPTWMVRELRYREDLRSGEDLVFWAQLLQRQPVEVAVAEASGENAYLRGLRDDSISRKPLTRDFAVTQRLACIKALENIKVKYGSPQATCLSALAKAQAGFIARYLESEPGAREEVVNEIEAAAALDFPWSVLNKGRANDLAFVYCFAPFSDTSAVVAAKALAERKRIVDVVTNDMSAVRKVDPAVSALADKWIDNRFTIKSEPSFAGWDRISDFARKALTEAEAQHAHNGGYEGMYSRALWVGSHVAAALFKLRHWNVRWTAEFSDPLRRDAEGKPRSGSITDNDVAQRLQTGIGARGFAHLKYDSLFDLVELATFVLADELIFTNQLQQEYMLSLLGDAELEKIVLSKSVVRPHPQPPASAYGVVETNYRVPSNTVNLAYFGNFYSNRGISDVLLALANASKKVRRRVRLHVFSNQRDAVAEAAQQFGVGANVHSNGYLPYMEFLNATQIFDVLLVNDVTREESMEINPFLPSKLSDYRGSGSEIWAIIDEGSAMSFLDFTYTTPVGDVPKMIATLETIAAD